MALQSTNYLMKLFKKQKKGAKFDDGLFQYLNDVDKVGVTKCRFKTPEEFADDDSIFEVLQHLSLSVYKRTNEKISNSSAAKKTKINSMFGLDLVTMA